MNLPGELAGGKQLLLNAVFAAVETQAHAVLDAGRAVQRMTTADGDPMVNLEPRELSAAPLGVSIDTEHLVTCFPGRNGMTYEVFSKDPHEIAESVAQLARAVVDGNYSEEINDGGEQIKVVAKWSEGDKVVRPRYNVLRAPRADTPGWQSISYCSY